MLTNNYYVLKGSNRSGELHYRQSLSASQLTQRTIIAHCQVTFKLFRRPLTLERSINEHGRRKNAAASACTAVAISIGDDRVNIELRHDEIAGGSDLAKLSANWVLMRCIQHTRLSIQALPGCFPRGRTNLLGQIRSHTHTFWLLFWAYFDRFLFVFYCAWAHVQLK